ncbi:adhesin [Yersinia frederiksenii]|uniref:Adhesin n=2 Tax=Yersinia frederiksenii TaxID=29484 RepID=A0A380PYJ8_YERFR|nr:filamentous hemagglutinin N-terminal domain-containing protein [Yersinia frederiksenii]ATM96959.1 heme utilization protein [Yersinia frederiksenii]KGA46568.1 hypothetical protein DJ58_1579 [Yersinia frederiksenii ATCC 33641]SUP78666.1 adhesin [Yersinia frederiksenii]
MNSKLYKLVFCYRLGCLVAVGEFTRAYGKSYSPSGRKIIKLNHIKVLNCLAIVTGLALGTIPLLVLAQPLLPVNGKVVIGQGALDINNTTLTVTQQTDKLAINWHSFDIAPGNSVIYNQPGTQSIALNRVLGSHASQIYGSLKANGQIFLLNPNGILFAHGAEINVGGLVATTKSLSDQDFINGRYILTSPKQEGSVINQANLRTVPGGYIALVGLRVNNLDSGVINTAKGRVILATGERVTLNLDHGQLLGVQVQGEQVAALIQNGGLIQADGGVIQLTARGKDMLMNTVINNTGILQANGLSEKNGVIHLDGGDEGVIRQQGVVNVAHPQGRGGDVTFQGKNIHLDAGSKIAAGGVDGGGQVLIGGGWQGENKQVRNAHSLVMDKGAEIDASATRKGHGGTVVLWSENYTGFYGDIKTRGGLESGNGGKVETSSRRNLQAFGQVDAVALAGESGVWLLDPAEVNIVGSGAESGASLQAGNMPTEYVTDAQVFIPTANVAQILNSSINSQLNSGTNVTVTTSNSRLLSCRWCNITLLADINKTAGSDATLTLHADGNIVANNNITANTGKLNINLLSGNLTVDSVITLNNNEVLLNGGDLVAKNASENNTARIEIVGGYYNIGNLTLEGNTGAASQVGVNISNAANITVAGETRITGESSNLNGQGWRSIEISDNSAIVGKGNVAVTLISNSKTAWMGVFSNTTITSDKNVTFQAKGNAWGGVAFNSSKLTAKAGDVFINLNGNIISESNQGVNFSHGSQVSGQKVNVESHLTGADGVLLSNSNIVATLGDINMNTTTTNKGVWISENSSLNASGNIALQGVTMGLLAGADAIKISGITESNRINIIAGADILLTANNNVTAQSSSLILNNVNLASETGNIAINGTGGGGAHFTNIELNTSVGNMAVYAETGTDLISTASSVLSLEGNNTIKARNGIVVGKALNTRQGGGIGFRENNILSVEGNITFQGETEGIGVTSKGVDFYGENTLNIVKGSQLSLSGESKGVQDTADGHGISHSGPIKLTINNDGYLKLEGRSTSGSGINFSKGNNTVIINGEGGAIIKGGSIAGSGVVISGVVNNSTGPVTIAGISTDGTGVHLFSTKHQVNRINITGCSTHAEGLRMSGNVTIMDTTLNGDSIKGSGVKIDSFPDANAATLTVLDNARLNGISTNGKGVEITREVKGIHQSIINAKINGTGYGLDIAENVNVTGTSETDLLTLKGVATTGFGTGIKLNGNNDLSNTSLNGSAVDGIALDIDGPLNNRGYTGLNGTASASGTGVHITGVLNSHVVNGTSASGSGVKVDGDTLLNNTALMGNSTAGKGVEIAGNLTGNQNSVVQGDSVNGIGMMIDNNASLIGGGGRDQLDIIGNATGDKGTGVQLDGNNILDNASLNGYAIDGIGLAISGPLVNTGNSAIMGNADKGDGVQLDGAVTGGTVNGRSNTGTGVKIDGDSSLDNVSLIGNSTDGQGVEITANLTGINGSAVYGDTVNGTGVAIGNNAVLIGGGGRDLLDIIGNATGDKGTGVQLDGNNTLDNTSLNGYAIDGIGLAISGPLVNTGNSAITGNADKGDGVQLDGAVTGGTVNGRSNTGTGVKIDGDSSLDSVTLIGNSTDGQGVGITANLTGINGSAVYGDTVNGTGVAISNNAVLIGGGDRDLLDIIGNATGDKGTGVQLYGNNILDNTSLAGNAIDGHGAKITGPVTNKSNATITGNASNNGHGVHINGPVSGGAINGTSGNSHGVYFDADAELTELAVIDSGKVPVHITSPELISENVTINGKPVDKTKFGRNTVLGANNSSIGKSNPSSDGKTSAARITAPLPERETASRLMKREQILSSLESQHFLPSIVTELTKDMAANISISLCIPRDVVTGPEPCDEHILGRWAPSTQTEP